MAYRRLSDAELDRLGRELAAALFGPAEAPPLAAAACRGRWRLFESRRHGERLDAYIRRAGYARAICTRSCPEFAECSRWERSGPAVDGTLGGRIDGAPQPLARHPHEQEVTEWHSSTAG